MIESGTITEVAKEFSEYHLTITTDDKRRVGFCIPYKESKLGDDFIMASKGKPAEVEADKGMTVTRVNIGGQIALKR